MENLKETLDPSQVDGSSAVVDEHAVIEGVDGDILIIIANGAPLETTRECLTQVI